MKSFIISQPKAGTYLCTNILKNLGLESTGMHVKNSKYRKYPQDQYPKFQNKQEVRNFIKKYTFHAKNFSEICQLIMDNQFAVGHLICESKYIKSLKPFKKILLLRDTESIYESLQRFSEEKFGNTSVKKEDFKKIEQWKKQPDVFVLNFNDMVNKNYKKINKLQKYLFTSVLFDSKIVLDTALMQNSLTKSSIR